MGSVMGSPWSGQREAVSRLTASGSPVPHLLQSNFEACFLASYFLLDVEFSDDAPTWITLARSNSRATSPAP